MRLRASLGGASRTRSLGLLASVIWLAVGCLGTSPDPHFYTLNAISTAQGAALDGEPLGIAVGPIQLPRYLRRPQIVTRRGDYRLDYHERHRWAASLESETLRVLGANFSVLLATDRVAVYPLQGGFPLKYRVRMDVEQFDGELSGEMRLQVRWVIGPGDGGDALAVGYSRLAEQVGSRYEDLVGAHSALLSALSHEITKRVRELEETEARDEPVSSD